MYKRYPMKRGGKRLYFYAFVVSGALMGAIVAGMIMLVKFADGVDASSPRRNLDKLYEKLEDVEYYDPKPKVVKVVMPAVVSITVEKIEGTRRKISSGSGFIVRKDGYIVTNNHVIEKARSILVTLYDKRTYRARVHGIDPKTDLAVIKIDAARLEAVRWGDSDKVVAGETIIAIGNPFGFLSHTVTDGIVSQTSRNRVGVISPEKAGQFAYEDFIQTNAVINPGNSGGPLFNMRGKVIGVNTAIVSKTGYSQQVGFSIPSNTAKFVAERLIKERKVVRGYVGVGIRNVDPVLAAQMRLSFADLLKKLGLNSPRGVYVSEVSGKPAKDAGIKQGDVVLKIAGKETNDTAALRSIVAELRPGKTADVEILRDKKPITLKVKIAEQPEK